MANPSIPNGLTPVRPMSAFSTSANQYSVPSSDGTLIGIGDLVKLVGTAQTINDITYPDVARAATGDVFVGAVTGVIPVTRDSTVYREASTQRVLVVCDDPNVLFEVQESAAGTSFTANDIGLNANIVVANASTTTG